MTKTVHITSQCTSQPFIKFGKAKLQNWFKYYMKPQPGWVNCEKIKFDKMTSVPNPTQEKEEDRWLRFQVINSLYLISGVEVSGNKQTTGRL